MDQILKDQSGDLVRITGGFHCDQTRDEASVCILEVGCFSVGHRITRLL